MSGGLAVLTAKVKLKGKPRGKPIQKGQALNPKGRPVGSRCKFQEDYFRHFHDLWQRRGAEVLEELANDPKALAYLAGSHMTKQVEIAEATIYESMSEDELIAELSKTLKDLRHERKTETLQ